MIYLGADHGGFQLKKEIKRYLESKNVEFDDLSDHEIDSKDDYPDIAVDSDADGVHIGHQRLIDRGDVDRGVVLAFV